MIGAPRAGEIYEGPLDGAARRAIGAHYTPPILAEPIVAGALDPLVFEGPREGLPRDRWRIRAPEEILAIRVCDPAMGAGAILVEACRYLSDRLIEARGASSDEDRWAARWDVAERCLYGVDRDPDAVALGRRSIRRFALGEDRPLPVLERSLLVGDALLGITDPLQIEHFHLDPARGQDLFGVVAPPDASDDDRRILADLVIGAAIASAMAGRGAIDRALAAIAPRVSAMLASSASPEDRARIARDLAAAARAMLDEGRGDRPARAPFHWPIAFPEIARAGGFDAIIGNPPFQCGTIAAARLSEAYMRCLRSWAPPWHGKADLATGFLKRAMRLVKTHGTVGLIMTSAMIRGESLESGLRPAIAEGYRIIAARSPRAWPGRASVDVVLAVLARAWRGACVLDGQRVEAIGEDLSASPAPIGAPPFRLASAIEAYLGIKLSPRQPVIRAADLDRAPAILRAIAIPAIGGDELSGLVDAPAESPRVIDPDLLAAIAPEDRREALGIAGIASIEAIAHARPAAALRARMLERALCFACGETAAHLIFRRVPVRGVLLKHKCVAFPADSFATFGLIQSSIHDVWAWRWGLRRQTRLTYSPKRCAWTFVSPGGDCAAICRVGEALHEARDEVFRARREGPTATYNRLHDRAERSRDLEALREIQVALDGAVVAAYGWDDLRLEHDFSPTDHGVRFTVSEPARREIVGRLLALNHRRHAEEGATPRGGSWSHGYAGATVAPTGL